MKLVSRQKKHLMLHHIYQMHLQKGEEFFKRGRVGGRLHDDFYMN